MTLFIASLKTETNTFSPIPTGRRAFFDTIARGDGSRQPPRLGNIPLIVWRRRAEADQLAIAESICATAEPAGTTLRAVYEELRDTILDDLRRAMPVDAVLLFMHGAMVADGYDDCEGDTLARVRAIVGPDVPIGIELDLHCHLTETMRRAADVLITYKEYPHTDVADRAEELYALIRRRLQNEIRPVIAFHDCGIVGMWRTSQEPTRGFVRRMQALEGQDGILSVSFGHGFPWGDVPDVGAKIVVVADGDEARAAALAKQLADEVWAARDSGNLRHDTIDEAIDVALAAPAGPVVLADVADNAGGGAPSDNTDILRRLLERGVTSVATGCYWDPVAVAFCREMGVGATFDLRIGGKAGPASGQPLDLRATVRGLVDDMTMAGLSGGRAKMGDAAWVTAAGIDIILNTTRTQTFAPDAFTGLGCTLADKRIVVVKSTQHFQAAFAPIALAIRYVATAGAIPPDFAAIPYRNRPRPYWPRVENPFA